MSFDSHARAVVKACAYHTHALRHVRHLLTTELATTIACSIVATRLDYCNSLLDGAPEATLDKLQRAQNNLARVVTCSARRSSAKPSLESRHWLPVRHRCIYKLATLTYKVQSTSRRLIFIHCSFHVLLLVLGAQAVRRGWSSLGHEQSSAVALSSSRRRPCGTLSRIMSSTLLVWQ